MEGRVNFLIIDLLNIHIIIVVNVCSFSFLNDIDWLIFLFYFLNLNFSVLHVFITYKLEAQYQLGNIFCSTSNFFQPDNRFFLLLHHSNHFTSF